VAENKEKDAITGVETTGHEWDGIKELNNPLPRWWLYVLYACIVWSIGYWIVMPAWPTFTGYTPGVIGHSQREIVAENVAAAQAAQSTFRDAILERDLEAIVQDAELLEFALAGGRAAFGDNCAPCHGSGAEGAPGYPNLNDDVWLWGGSLEDILTTITYGIRSDHDETRSNEMPAFLADGLLERQEVSDVVAHVLNFSGRAEDPEAATRGAEVYADNCAGCHGEAGHGEQALGAPDLTDSIWLFGGERADIMATVSNGRAGVMPHWQGRLDPVTIKQLVVHVHSLGGGQ
jgi:cytochrome c oxidase cbb3-type subunit 3